MKYGDIFSIRGVHEKRTLGQSIRKILGLEKEPPPLRKFVVSYTPESSGDNYGAKPYVPPAAAMIHIRLNSFDVKKFEMDKIKIA